MDTNNPDQQNTNNSSPQPEQPETNFQYPYQQEQYKLGQQQDDQISQSNSNNQQGQNIGMMEANLVRQQTSSYQGQVVPISQDVVQQGIPLDQVQVPNGDIAVFNSDVQRYDVSQVTFRRVSIFFMVMVFIGMVLSIIASENILEGIPYLISFIGYILCLQAANKARQFVKDRNFSMLNVVVNRIKWSYLPQIISILSILIADILYERGHHDDSDSEYSDDEEDRDEDFDGQNPPPHVDGDDGYENSEHSDDYDDDDHYDDNDHDRRVLMLQRKGVRFLMRMLKKRRGRKDRHDYDDDDDDKKSEKFNRSLKIIFGVFFILFVIDIYMVCYKYYRQIKVARSIQERAETLQSQGGQQQGEQSPQQLQAWQDDQ